DTGHLSPRASVLPGSAKDQERWKQGKKVDLIELVESELRQLLKEYPLTLEEVQTVGFAIKKQEQQRISNGEGSVSSKYSSQDLDNPRTQLALRLNSVNKDLAKIRFSLVPSRLKEPVFWEATLHLVKERLIEYNNDRCKQQNVGSGTTQTKSEPLTNGDAVPPNGNGQGSKSIYHKLLEEQLAKKDAEIADLKKQLEDVQETLLDVAKLPSSQPTSAPSTTTMTTTTTTTEQCQHTGQWKMSKDSEEFLAYPEQVKGAMRAEKQKRLNQVKEELKFILDSDDVADSHGQWNCCGNTDYDADCGTRVEI
ncbi:MAG: hypothetical protein SGBAC_013053, partial [Bacillariaceae sp.]